MTKMIRLNEEVYQLLKEYALKNNRSISNAGETLLTLALLEDLNKGVQS